MISGVLRFAAPVPRFGLAGCVTLLLLVADAAAQQAPTVPGIDSLPALQARLSNHLAQPRFARAFWGVKIVSLDSGKTLFEHDADKLFSPASNAKLYTTALALQRLGPDYRIQTSWYSAKPPSKSGVIGGDLIVFGRGDPTFNARLHGDDIFQALRPLVAILTSAGVRRVKGNLVADESFFRGPRYGSGWDWDDVQYYYGAEVSSLTINDNVMQLAVKPGEQVGRPCQFLLSPPKSYIVVSNFTRTSAQDSRRVLEFQHPLGENFVRVTGQMPLGDAGQTEDLPVRNPAGLFAALLQDALARAKIKVSGRCRVVSASDRWSASLDTTRLAELGSVGSPPLGEILREIGKPSQNLYTDLLLAHIGALAQMTNASAARQTSEEAGIRELNRFLEEVGIPPGSVIFEEGSGLSRNNLTTPAATVHLLEYMSRQPHADVYRDALPIAGIDGTLRNRMKGTPAAGNVRAKTGTLRWANSLSGYVTTAAGEHLAFSVMLNRYQNADPSHATRLDIDAIAEMLAGYTGRTPSAGARAEP